MMRWRQTAVSVWLVVGVAIFCSMLFYLFIINTRYRYPLHFKERGKPFLLPIKPKYIYVYLGRSTLKAITRLAEYKRSCGRVVCLPHNPQNPAM
jgi:hypothetical protein